MSALLTAVRGGMSHRWMLICCLAAAWLLWGSTFVGIRALVADGNALAATSQRFLIGGVLLALIAGARRGVGALRIGSRQVASLCVSGVLLLGVGNGLQVVAQQHGLPSGTAALVTATGPAWAVILRASAGDRPAALTQAGVGLGFVGVALLMILGRGLDNRLPLAGVLFCLIASFSWTFGAFLQRFLDMPQDIIVVATYQQLVGCVAVGLLAVCQGESLTASHSVRGWIALLYLATACSVVAFLAFVWLVTYVPLPLAATHAYVNPVVAVFLGWLLYSEPVGAPILMGGGLVVAAIALVVASERLGQPRQQLGET